MRIFVYDDVIDLVKEVLESVFVLLEVQFLIVTLERLLTFDQNELVNDVIQFVESDL